MTKGSGQIAPMIIAAVIAILLAASWLPSRDHGMQDAKIAQARDFTRLIREEANRKPEVPRPEPVAQPVHTETHEAHGTAMPSSRAAAIADYNREEKTVEPDRKDERKSEAGTMEMSWWNIFFAIKLTDLVLIGIGGGILWNVWQIRKSVYQIRIEAATQTLEAQHFSRAAEAMEAVQKTAVATEPEPEPELAPEPVTPTTAIPDPAAPKPPRKKRTPKNAAAPVSDQQAQS